MTSQPESAGIAFGKATPTGVLVWTLGCLILWVCPIAAGEKPAELAPPEQELIREALWGSPERRTQVLDQLRSWPRTPERLQQVEAIIRAGRVYGTMVERQQTVPVSIEAQRKLNVFVQLPPSYDPARRYPLLIAISGGPPPTEQGATGRAKAMLALWAKPAEQAGWIVAAIEDRASVRLPGKKLRYFILSDYQLQAIRNKLLERYAIDGNRIHVTGISLGSNYALAYAASHPDWFAGIAPVSTEGESREHVVRNLRHVGVYILEGAKDKAIRTIDGPRKLAEILTEFGYPHRYEEDPKRGHEGFADKYPQVLQWLAERPRPAFPKEIIRLPHAGILLPDKRFYWLKADTHQAAFQAKVEGNVIAVQAARVRRLTFHLSDRLLDLREPVVIRVNGQVVHDQRLERSLVTAIEDAAFLNDTERFATARISVAVPNLSAGEKWLASLAPQVEPSRLPFWEDFALITLQEKRSDLQAELEPLADFPNLPPGQVAHRVKSAPASSSLRPGDVLLRFDNEPFFAEAESQAFLKDYLLRTSGNSVELQIVRDGKEQRVVVDLLKKKL